MNKYTSKRDLKMNIKTCLGAGSLLKVFATLITLSINNRLRIAEIIPRNKSKIPSSRPFYSPNTTLQSKCVFPGQKSMNLTV